MANFEFGTLDGLVIFEDPIVTFTFPPGANGILPDRMIAAMADAGLILPDYPFVESQIQPASLDLRLGNVAYRVRASFLPGPGATVAERIDELKLHEIDLTDGAVLETNCVYIVPLLESLALPPMPTPQERLRHVFSPDIPENVLPRPAPPPEPEPEPELDVFAR